MINIVTKLKFNEYLPIEIVFTLKQYYNVCYFETTYYYDNKGDLFTTIPERTNCRVDEL